MGLPMRGFGSTGWELTTVGLGTWALGGGDWAFGWGPQDDDESVAALRARGVTIGLAFVVAVVEILIKLFTGYNYPGYTSTIFAILFLGGVQLITIGILGEYVGRVYDEIKGRPLYLVAENVGNGLGEPSDSAPSTVPLTR